MTPARRRLVIRSYVAIVAAICLCLIVEWVRQGGDTYSYTRAEALLALTMQLVALALILGMGFHMWYFRREWDFLRSEWVERHPRLRRFIRTEPVSDRQHVLAVVVGIPLGVLMAVVITLLLVLFAV